MVECGPDELRELDLARARRDPRHKAKRFEDDVAGWFRARKLAVLKWARQWKAKGPPKLPMWIRVRRRG